MLCTCGGSDAAAAARSAPHACATMVAATTTTAASTARKHETATLHQALLLQASANITRMRACIVHVLLQEADVKNGTDRSGCTALAAFITPDYVVIAHAGDSRAIMCSGGEVAAATEVTFHRYYTIQLLL
jgi:serine/threonine protein phosphatase PrpC